MDKEYFDEQKRFIDSLTTSEKYFIRTYTYKGYFFLTQFESTPTFIETGMSIVKKLIKENKGTQAFNPFLPTKLEDITKENLIDNVIQYGLKMQKIFEKAPKIKYATKVYRGLRERYNQEKEGLLMSTTYNINEPHFADWFIGKDCCLLEITLYPGVQTIVINKEISKDITTVLFDQYEVIVYMENVNMKCSNEEIRKQKIGNKTVSLYDCQIIPKDYNLKTPLMGRPPKLGGKTRKLRKIKKSFGPLIR